VIHCVNYFATIKLRENQEQECTTKTHLPVLRPEIGLTVHSHRLSAREFLLARMRASRHYEGDAEIARSDNVRTDKATLNQTKVFHLFHLLISNEAMTTIHMTIREHWRITQLPRNKWWNDKAQQSTYCCPASTQVGHTQRERERTVTTFEQSRLTMEHPSAEKESNTLKEKRIKSCLSRFDSGAYSRLHFLRAVSQSVGSHTESTAACRQQQQQQRRRRDVGTRTHYYTLTDRPTVCRPIISLVTKNVPFAHSNKSSNVLY